MARRVLVVDDNRSLGRMIGELLVEAGAEARVFDTSQIACVFRKPFSPARVIDALVPRAKGIDGGAPRVARAMTRPVTSCTPEHDLAEAARLMWDNDRGFLVVLDGRARLVGVITDRDICMAAYTRGRALHQISVASAMSREVRTCSTDDTLEQAARVMRDARVRRLPVVDPTGAVVGVLSLSDLAGWGDATASAVVGTLASITGPRLPRTESKVA